MVFDKMYNFVIFLITYWALYWLNILILCVNTPWKIVYLQLNICFGDSFHFIYYYFNMLYCFIIINYYFLINLCMCSPNQRHQSLLNWLDLICPPNLRGKPLNEIFYCYTLSDLIYIVSTCICKMKQKHIMASKINIFVC